MLNHQQQLHVYTNSVYVQYVISMIDYAFVMNLFQKETGFDDNIIHVEALSFHLWQQGVDLSQLRKTWNLSISLRNQCTFWR